MAREFRLEYFRIDTAKTEEYDGAGQASPAMLFAHYSTRLIDGADSEKTYGDISAPFSEFVDFIQANPTLNALPAGTNLLQALPEMRKAVRQFVKSKIEKLANATAVNG